MSRSAQLYNEMRVYHAANPHVYELACDLAEQARRSGHARYGFAAIWEVIRWRITVGTNDTHFKMPNNHRAYYARLYNAEHPQNPPFFRTAKLRSEGGRVDRFGRPLDGDEEAAHV